MNAISSDIKKVFSFCLYGGDLKYYYGMEENIKLIKSSYPDFFILIWIGKTRLEHFIEDFAKIENVICINTNVDGVYNMFYRYMPLTMDTIDIFFSRDADSEVSERDKWCIDEFLESPIAVHTIRDNYWHKSRLTGGLTGFKKNLLDPNRLKMINTAFSKVFNYKNEYGMDERFIVDTIYPCIKDDILVHTSMNAFEDEKGYKTIDFPNNGKNFAGNVVEYSNRQTKKYKFDYWEFDYIGQIVWLFGQKQYKIIIELCSYINLMRFSELMLEKLYTLAFSMNELTLCKKIIREFEYNSINNNTIVMFDRLFQLETKKIIATTNIKDEPAEDEIMVYYGNYPVSYQMFPVESKVYRNAMYFVRIKHHKVLSHPCWDKIDQIYILNLEIRFDRYIETLGELCRMNAPLDKVYHYKAKKDENVKDAYVGATQNHLDAMKHMIASKYKNCLILEDDIVFTNMIEKHQSDLTKLFNKNYTFDIVFLSASKMHKRLPYDDLFILSKQVCTTSSAYILNENTVKDVHKCVNEGNELLKTTGESTLYCIDRYWAKLQQRNKVYIFKQKMIYQRPSFSNLKNEVVAFLD